MAIISLGWRSCLGRKGRLSLLFLRKWYQAACSLVCGRRGTLASYWTTAAALKCRRMESDYQGGSQLVFCPLPSPLAYKSWDCFQFLLDFLVGSRICCHLHLHPWIRKTTRVLWSASKLFRSSLSLFLTRSDWVRVELESDRRNYSW